MRTTPTTSASYDQLADYYHLLFENWQASIERQAAALSAILERTCGLPRTARILDCACGIGTQSLGLAKLGFRVTGCDVSSRSVERARLEASQRDLSIQFSVANMLDLERLDASRLDASRFDTVICMDNALPHLESPEQLVQAAVQIRARLRAGGLLMASIRDYDLLIQERPVVQGPSFYSDQGQRRIVFQVWDWVDDRRYVFHLYITRQVETGWQTFHTSALYRAIRRDEVTAALSEAGFGNTRWLSRAESRFYQPIVLANVD